VLRSYEKEKSMFKEMVREERVPKNGYPYGN
jgi:hypothetical protein